VLLLRSVTTPPRSKLSAEAVKKFENAASGLCNIRDTSRLATSDEDDMIYGDFTLEGVKGMYDVVNRVGGGERKTWVDMGCGSGLVLLALKLLNPVLHVHGVEIVKPLADVARRVMSEHAGVNVVEGDFLANKSLWSFKEVRRAAGNSSEIYTNPASFSLSFCSFIAPQPVVVFCHSTVVFTDESMEKLGERARGLPPGSFMVSVGRGVEGLEVVREVVGRAEWGAEIVIIQKV